MSFREDWSLASMKPSKTSPIIRCAEYKRGGEGVNKKDNRQRDFLKKTTGRVVGLRMLS